MEIISASYALPMTDGCPVEADGAIAVELSKILAFGSAQGLAARFPGAEVKSHQGAVLMPGLVDAHCHLDLVAFHEASSALGDDRPAGPTEFVDSLVASMDFKRDARPEGVIAGIQRGIARLIEGGCTCVGDMTSFEGTFKLLREMGLRAVVFPEILAGRGEAAQQKFEIALALVEKYTDATHDRVRVGLGPCAPYLLSRNLLRVISQHARDASIPVMIHAAESFAEMEFFFDSQGAIASDVFPALGWKELPPAQRRTPVDYLSEIGFLDAPAIIVGGMHLSHRDFPLLKKHLTRVVWCPTAAGRMGHGAFPLSKLSGHGVPIGLGTDLWHKRGGFNLWDEMRAATQGGAEPPAFPREALRMATVGGAKALGLDHLIGTLEEGKRADYMILSAPASSPSGADSLCAAIVAKTQPNHIKEVVVGGHILKAI